MMPFNLIERVKNMTRETKLGLVVSCSFLGLLGAVLAMKMTESPEEEQAAEVAAATQNEGAPPAERSGAPEDKGAGTKPAPAPAVPPPSPFPKDVPAQPIVRTGATTPSAGAPAKPGGTPLPPLPPGQGTGQTGSEKSGATNPPKGTDDSLPAIPAALPPPAAPPAVTGKQPPANEGGFWSSLWGTATGTTVAVVKNAAKKGPDGKSDNKPLAKADTTLPPVAATPAGPKLPDVAPPAGAGGGGPMTVEPPPLARAGEATSQANGSGTLPALPPAPPPTDNKGTGTAPPAPPPIAPAPGGTTSPAERLRPIPAAPLPPMAPADPGAGGAGGATPPPSPAPVKPPAATPTFEVPPIAPKPSVPIGGLPPVKEPEPIAVGRPPSASVPALPVPSVPVVRGAQPDVVSYTEETYVAGTGDSFQSISRAKYGTDGYARALYLFNRSHPLAGDDLLQSDALKARQPVYLPPAEILQSRYPDAVGDAKGAAGTGVTVGSTSQRASTAPAPRTYRVGAGGEKVYDIASKMLGDGNRWVEIRDLNPGWKPELPIPAGTTLRLPQ